MRNTDADWIEIARSEPYYGVLADERFRGADLDESTLDEFYASGASDIAFVVSEFAKLTGESSLHVSKALDFGCGVGRQTLAMAEYADEVVGVDVAKDMLKRARSRAKATSAGSVKFRDELPGDAFDWINSLIVFQHIPPNRGQELFERLLRQVTPNGFISLHVTFYKDRRHQGEVLGDVDDYRFDGTQIEVLSKREKRAVGSMSMFDYDLNRIFRALVTAGYPEVLSKHIDHGGCHGVWLFARRTDAR